jgi:hypothetical protein
VLDEEIRRLEVRAAAGDADAAAGLERARARIGVPVCDVAHVGRTHRACSHLVARAVDHFRRSFTGRGIEQHLLCAACAAATPDLADVCPACFARTEADLSCHGFRGEPEVLERASGLAFAHATIPLPELLPEAILEIRPVPRVAEPLWLALDASLRIHAVDLLARRTVWSSPPLDLGGVDPRRLLRLHVSPRGEVAAIVNDRGQHGVVVDARTGASLLRLDRGTYHPEVSSFPVAFFEREGRLLLAHGTDWNRLDVTDPRSGACVTARSPAAHERPDTRPEHYLDYFNGGLAVSPGDDWIVGNGWVWHPVGLVRSWSLARWIAGNVWESEDGPSVRNLAHRAYFWDGPLTWVGARRIALYGYGDDDENLKPAALILDVETGKLERWFAGPCGPFTFDRYLFSASPEDGTSVWDVDTGERLCHEKGLTPHDHHTGAHHLLSRSDRELRLSWLVER